MVDSCNHRGSLPSTQLEFSPLTRTLSLKVSQGGVKRGQQVFITYGARMHGEGVGGLIMEREDKVEDVWSRDRRVRVGLNVVL